VSGTSKGSLWGGGVMVFVAVVNPAHALGAVFMAGILVMNAIYEGSKMEHKDRK